MNLLGLPLDVALNRLAQQGIEGKVILSRAPRDRNEGGTLRVVRSQGNVLTVCAFPDGTPVRREME